MLQNGLGIKQNYARAEKYYRRAAEQGNGAGQYCLSLMYQYGLGVCRNYSEANNWLRKSSERRGMVRYYQPDLSLFDF